MNRSARAPRGRPGVAGTSLASRRQARVLVVEDEAPIREMLTTTLSFAGFEVSTAGRCDRARVVAEQTRPELALLDVMLPDGSGFELCRSLRADHPDLGVIFLTARDGIDDVLTGLTLGGDDYVTKPFSVAEVVARLNVLLRRLGTQDRSQALRVGDLELDERSHRVSRDGEVLDLSPTEFKLLHYLMQNPDVVVSKQQILRQVWRYDVIGDSGVVEKFISQLRRKIDSGRPPLLHTVRGFGYVIREPRG